MKPTILTAAVLGFALLAPSRADDESDLQERIDQLQSELDQLQADREQADTDARYHCGSVTGWARGWYPHRGHKHGH
jgi:hypothetical protein